MAHELVSGGQPAARLRAGHQPGSRAPRAELLLSAPPDSVGCLAHAVAFTTVIPARGGRITAIAFTALLTAAVGLSRIDLRAPRACNVLAGEALAVMRYH